MPRSPGPKLAAIGCVLLLTLGALTLPLVWARWRDECVYRSLLKDSAPEPWWPAAWRRERESSILFEGGLRKSRDGTLEIEVNGNRSFRTPISKGRFSFHPRILPAGSFRFRRIAPDGTASDWLGPPLSLDPGSHRFDLGF